MGIQHDIVVPQDPSGFRLATKAIFPQWAHKEAGAPLELHTEVASRAGSERLQLDITWVNKIATRLPEVRQLRSGPCVTLATGKL